MVVLQNWLKHVYSFVNSGYESWLNLYFDTHHLNRNIVSALIFLKPNIIWNSCKRYDLLWKRKISPTNLILTILHANVIVQMRGNKWNYSKNRNMWWQMHSHGCRRTKSQSSYFFVHTHSNKYSFLQVKVFRSRTELSIQ